MSLLLSPHSAPPGVRRRTLSSRVEVGTFSLMVVVIFLALAVSLLYLAHANRTATRGYAIKRLEIEKNALQTEIEIWEHQVSEARSLEAIKTSGILDKMQPVKDPIYLRADLIESQEIRE